MEASYIIISWLPGITMPEDLVPARTRDTAHPAILYPGLFGSGRGY